MGEGLKERTASLVSKSAIDGEFPGNPQTQADSVDYQTLVQEVQNIGTRMDTMVNISIVLLVGIGIIAGILCSTIFSRYIRS